MDIEKIDALDKIYDCIKSNKNFVLQGGAGSGKTESLKRVLEFISSKYPNKKSACITHTNLAVEEIRSRVGEGYTIETIHSFLNSLIKDYKKNIHEVISEIFKVEKIERKDLCDYINEKDQKTKEHEKYKKVYGKYTSRLYSVNKATITKVIGKREYDISPISYNDVLNELIDKLNFEIEAIIYDSDYKDINKVKYNETRFDSFKDLTFSHDNLLKISSLLFDRFPLLSKIIQDKFDFILIDEYQDTNKEIIGVFLNKISQASNTTIGLFGDSMQGIYDDGIGDVESFISDKILFKINKEDNYRCSEQVVHFINQFRNDKLIQEVAFKTNADSIETRQDRQGEVKLYYAIYDGDRTPGGTPRNKEEYLDKVNLLISKVDEKYSGFKKLMLTNKSIAKEVGFNNLYDVFNDRYSEVKEEIEKDLTRLQLIDLVTLCDAYKSGNYNFVLTKIKMAGFEFKSIADKKIVSEILNIVTTSDKSAIEVLESAFKFKIIKQSDSYLFYIDRIKRFLKELDTNVDYIEFRKNYKNDGHTFTKMKNLDMTIEEEAFNELEKVFKKERFYNEFFSDKIKFKEIVNYYDYLNEKTKYITMHKTKGTGIQNVILILEEFFWTKYKFKTIFDSIETDLVKKLYNQKLFYVGCSRAIENLICVKLIESSEEEDLVSYFINYEKLTL